MKRLDYTGIEDIESLDFSPDSKLLFAAGSNSENICVYDVDEGIGLFCLFTKFQAYRVKYIPNSDIIAFTTYSNDIHLWDFKKEKFFKKFKK